MKKFLVGMLCLALCGGIALTSCAEKKEEEVAVEKEIKLDFTDDYEEKIPVFEYHFSGGEATLIGYHPENAEEGEELATDIVLPEKPVKIKTQTVEEPAVVDGKNVIIKKKIEVVDDEKEYELTAIEAGVFSGNTDITSVVIPDTVTAIGEGAFQGCTSLKSVTLPASLEEIKDFTFNGCSSLEELNIPEGITSVGLYAFGEYFDQIPWYKNLPATSVIVGDGVLLKYNGAAADVVYGDEVKAVSYYAFTDSAATSITFTNATEEFDTQAFYRCGATVYLPSDSTKISELKMNSVKVETYEAPEVAEDAVEEAVEGEVTEAGEETTEPVEGEVVEVEAETEAEEVTE